jgi:hypothetical protein
MSVVDPLVAVGKSVTLLALSDALEGAEVSSVKKKSSMISSSKCAAAYAKMPAVCVWVGATA